MIVPFFKMHGTGNDFIVIDNRPHHIQKYTNNQELIANLCNRHLGIGGDGLILLNTKVGFDFEMVYYNADGFEGTMCGNGGRCAVAVADMLNMCKGKAEFMANNSTYTASVIKKRDKDTYVHLNMNNVLQYENRGSHYFLDTGSPHHVEFVQEVMHMNVKEEGRKVRNSALYAPNGTNVNFVEIMDNHLFVRTFERGVEDETLSCGTGVVASALAAFLKGVQYPQNEYHIKTKGGQLKVAFSTQNDTFTCISLEGPATFVFKGEIEI